MDGFVLTLWLVRILFLRPALRVPVRRRARAAARPARGQSRGPAELGPAGRPRVAARRAAAGASFPLDAVTTLGRDVNNGIVLDDPFASAEHAVLTFRGRAWYVEDLAQHQRHLRQRRARSRASRPLGFGDELQVGEVRFRLDRGRE